MRPHRTVLCVLAGLVLAGAAAPARPDDPAGSRAAAVALKTKLDAIEASRRAGRAPAQKVYTVSDAELNAYLQHLGKLPPSLSAVRVRFEKDRVHADGLLDLDQLQGRLPTGGGLGALAFFSGKVAVVVSGKLESADGFGRLELEEVRVGSLPLSPTLLAPIVAQATKGGDYPQGFDILSPFRLPYAAQRVRVQPGQARLEF